MHSLVTAPTLIEQVELARIHAAGQLNPARRAELGQFFTPAPLAQLMGALLPGSQRHVSLLDAGAGVGSLLSAGVEALANAPEPPQADEFATRFTPGCEVLYVGDTDEKFAYFARERARELGIVIDAHGKMPDVVLYYRQKDWLVLIEAVTSHGPIDAKRRADLVTMFRNARPGLVFVTAFLTRQAMREYLPLISWETEVWVAESPSHLIHFDGERFLGPY